MACRFRRPSPDPQPPGPGPRSLPTVGRYRKLRRNCHVVTSVQFLRLNNSGAKITRTLETVGTALAQEVYECVRKCRGYRSDSPKFTQIPGMLQRSSREVTTTPLPPAPPNVYPREKKRRIALNFAPTATGSQKHVYRGEDNNHTSRGQPSVSLSFSHGQLSPHLSPRFSADPSKFP